MSLRYYAHVVAHQSHNLMEVVIRLSFNKIYNDITIYITKYSCVLITIIYNIKNTG